MRLSLILAAGLIGCAGTPSGGPRERVRDFGGCAVPPGTIQLHDQLDGSAEGWQYFAKIVMPPSRFEGFLSTCGLEIDDLRLGHEHAHLGPRDANGTLRSWWRLPEANAVAGMSGRYRELLIVERDTDVAAFIVATNPSP
ncbi:MAG: hypothetical protein AB8H86_10485 [Polyangiales bacterium]